MKKEVSARAVYTICQWDVSIRYPRFILQSIRIMEAGILMHWNCNHNKQVVSLASLLCGKCLNKLGESYCILCSSVAVLKAKTQLKDSQNTAWSTTTLHACKDNHLKTKSLDYSRLEHSLQRRRSGQVLVK